MGDGRQIHWPAGHIPRQPGLGPLYTGPKGPRVVLRPYRQTKGYSVPLPPAMGREVSLFCHLPLRFFGSTANFKLN